MSDGSRPLTLGDMVVGLVAELQERVELTGEARRIVLLTVALAANNGRLLGLDEALERAREQGVDLDLRLSKAEKDAPSTLGQTLGGARAADDDG